MRKRHLLAPAGAVLVLLVAALTAVDWVTAARLAAAQKTEPQTHTIVIKGFIFQPETLTVKAGDTVIWKNEDIVPHTATANGKRFDSKSIETKASWKYVATKPGSYPYICSFHPTMKATLTVKP